MAIHNIGAVFADGTALVAERVEFTFDADNGVIYVYVDDGISYLNFNHVQQFGARVVE